MVELTRVLADAEVLAEIGRRLLPKAKPMTPGERVERWRRRWRLDRDAPRGWLERGRRVGCGRALGIGAKRSGSDRRLGLGQAVGASPIPACSPAGPWSLHASGTPPPQLVRESGVWPRTAASARSPSRLAPYSP